MADLAVKSKSNVQVFENSEFGKVRTVVGNDGEPWFVAADIARVPEMADATHAVRGLEEDERGIHKVETRGGEQDMAVITEAGLYTVLVRSNKAIAKPFRRWVTHEVLPSIRKHGAYVTPSLIDQILADPDMMIRLLTELKEERAKSTALADKVEEQAIELNESERYWTIAKYNRMNKLGWSLDACKKAGKEASRYARLHNYQIKRCETNDERFGWVNSYPLDMLKILFKK